MRATQVFFMVAAAAMLALAGCGSRDKPPILMNVAASANSNGPDEFAILPPKGLSLPDDLAALPEPTPGGTNLTDPSPQADAIIALGGTPGAGSGGDAGLINAATRYGTAQNIRGTLAAEDLEFRRDNDGRILERIFNVNVYFRAYEDQSLDQQADLLRWRRAGVRTPSAPPPLDGE